MAILSSLFRRSLENPMTPFTDPDAWIEMFGGGKASSGVTVNRDSALSNAAIWRGVNIVSRDIAKVPLHVLRRKGVGKERDTEHPAFGLLRRKPNPLMTAFVFKQTLQSHVMLEGNAYACIIRNESGVPIELWPLSPEVTIPTRNTSGGQLMYSTLLTDRDDEPGETVFLFPYEVLHIKGLGFDGLTGYSVIDKAKESLGEALASHKFTSLFFANDATPGVVLEHPGKLEKPAMKNIRTSWEKAFRGLDKSHRVAVLREGMQAKQIGDTLKDSVVPELRQDEIREAANWIGVPPHMLGDTTRTSYNSLEQERQSYADESLDGWMVPWEEECEDKLLTTREKDADTHVVEFLRQALVRTDMATRTEGYKKSLAGVPWMMVDEVRALENLEPLPDGMGETFIIPKNVGEFGEEEEEEPAPVQPPGPVGDDDEEEEDEDRTARMRAAYDALLRDRVSHAVRRITMDAARASKRPSEFCAWVDGGMDAKHRSVLRDSLEPVVRAIMATSDEDPSSKLDVLVGAILERVRTEFNDAAECSPPETLPKEVDVRAQWLRNKLPGELVAAHGGVMWN